MIKAASGPLFFWPIVEKVIVQGARLGANRTISRRAEIIAEARLQPVASQGDQPTIGQMIGDQGETAERNALFS